MPKRIGLVTYETPFAPCGGIAAVMSRLPGALDRATKCPVGVITPYHRHIAPTTAARAEMDPVATVRVTRGPMGLDVDILRHPGRAGYAVPHYFVAPRDHSSFAGARHPYDVPAHELLEDALLFGVAVARATEAIAPGAQWLLMVHDWEAATAALAAQRDTHRVLLTLHNSYDCGVTDAQLAHHGIDAATCPGETVLQRVLGLPNVAGPVSTVSTQFAADLTEDVLQARIMAPHLQHLLRPRLRGIENGLFVERQVPDDCVAAMRRGDYQPFANWKHGRRAEALAQLDRLVPTETLPVWGDRRRFDRDSRAAWFVLAGRDDPRQKGYEVAAAAVTRFLESGGDARFVFFPMPGDLGLGALSFLMRLACRFPDRVLVMPFRWTDGYLAALQGGTYGVMPSLYEPFGMANEFYLNGLAAVGRATGGLLQQIVPFRTARCFTPAVQWRADRWSQPATPPTGLLCREPDDESAAEAWRELNAIEDDRADPTYDRAHARRTLPLINAMARALATAFDDAVTVYRNQPTLYYEMVREGMAHVERTFSWERSSREYLKAADALDW